MARILIIDPSPVAAAALGRWLRIDGHETQVLGRMVELIDTLAEFRPHLVIVDLTTPGFDGSQFARALRRTSAGAPPVILYSGSDQSKLRAAAGAMGPFDVVSKLGPSRDIRVSVARALASVTFS